MKDEITGRTICAYSDQYTWHPTNGKEWRVIYAITRGKDRTIPLHEYPEPKLRRMLEMEYLLSMGESDE